MQDEINEKIVSLCIKGGRISAQILKNAIIKALAQLEQDTKLVQQKMRTNKQAKTVVAYRGKQSMRKLKEGRCELSNIEVTDGNIKSFEKYARKYNIDYSLQKDKSTEPPRYFVFFKAKDVDSMTAAFKEYTGWQMNKDKKVSIRKKLAKAIGRVAKHQERAKTKSKDRETML